MHCQQTLNKFASLVALLDFLRAVAAGPTLTLGYNGDRDLVVGGTGYNDLTEADIERDVGTHSVDALTFAPASSANSKSAANSKAIPPALCWTPSPSATSLTESVAVQQAFHTFTNTTNVPSILTTTTPNTTTRLTTETYQTLLFHLRNTSNAASLICTTTVSKSSPTLLRDALSPGALQILTLPNAGGDSVASEVLSFDMFATLFNATLSATEMQVRYYPQGGSILDYVMRIHSRLIGVSVTRAFAGGAQRRKYTAEDATRLLYKKLTGAKCAMRNLFVPEGVEGCLLHVWVRDGEGARVVRKAWRRLREDVKGRVVVVVSVCNVDAVFAKGMKVVWE
ncbi:hypothetical protein HK097_009474 [Rhizophlyctis rosea]|uniref:Uncharacterized protein n=1 Tax=Rhizophlyctis rosea TaxID=64517 RepID=A0AAD5SB88_9FUNG|nr:hypothetical protein HK097_009474 [Rhizophlyctis rosea]